MAEHLLGHPAGLLHVAAAAAALVIGALVLARRKGGQHHRVAPTCSRCSR